MVNNGKKKIVMMYGGRAVLVVVKLVVVMMARLVVVIMYRGRVRVVGVKGWVVYGIPLCSSRATIHVFSPLFNYGNGGIGI